MKQKEYQFGDVSQVSYDSAMRILPFLIKITGVPGSVVDLGGGLGSWCAAFKKLGSAKVRCIDHPSAKDADLFVSPQEFVRCDLDRGLPAPERADLAMSLEFAEHMNARLNESIVKFLCDSSDVVLFSAAVPRQPGHGHINTRFARYWRELFRRRGFERHDVIRPQILLDEEIPRWFRVNLFLFANEKGRARLKLPAGRFLPEGTELVDEDILTSPANLGELLSGLPDALKRAVLFRFRRRTPPAA